ncbi:MAG: hypothetical protein U1F26_07040 [Lysobacterales bacterium]
MTKNRSPLRVDSRFVSGLIEAAPRELAWTLVNWKESTDWDPDIFASLGPLVCEFLAEEEASALGLLYVPVPMRTGEPLERLLRNQLVKMYVAEPSNDFFASISGRLLTELSHGFSEFSASAIDEASQLGGYFWLILADGNESSKPYYYWPGRSGVQTGSCR